MAWKQMSARNHLSNRWIAVDEKDFELPDGTRLPSYWLVTKPAYVVVVAESESGMVLIREWRPGSGKTHTGFPAGYIDPGETPLEAAAREFREETGYELTEARVLGVLEPQPGWLDCECHVAGGRAKAPETEPHLDSEIDEVLVLPRGEVLERIRLGGITEMHSVAAFLLALK